MSAHVDVASEHMDRSVVGRWHLKWGGWLTVRARSAEPDLAFCPNHGPVRAIACQRTAQLRNTRSSAHPCGAERRPVDSHSSRARHANRDAAATSLADRLRSARCCAGDEQALTCRSARWSFPGLTNDLRISEVGKGFGEPSEVLGAHVTRLFGALAGDTSERVHTDYRA